MRSCAQPTLRQNKSQPLTLMPLHPSAINTSKADINPNDYKTSKAHTATAPLHKHTLPTHFKGWLSQHHYHSLLIPHQKWPSKNHLYSQLIPKQTPSQHLLRLHALLQLTHYLKGCYKTRSTLTHYPFHTLLRYDSHKRYILIMNHSHRHNAIIVYSLYTNPSW